MNIVLIGSCLDSSNLAKELNKKMKNSVVFRIDLLKNLKNIIPFSNITNENCGTYLGDVEKISFDRLTSTEKDISKKFFSSVKAVEEDPSLQYALSTVSQYTPTVDRVTRNFDSLSLTLLRVVSGLQTVAQLRRYLNSSNSSVVVYLESPDKPLFDTNITKEQFLEIKEDEGINDSHLFLSTKDVNSLLVDELFNSIVNPVEEKKEKVINLVAEEKEEVKCIERSLARDPSTPGILTQIAHLNANQTLTTTMLDTFLTELATAA